MYSGYDPLSHFKGNGDIWFSTERDWGQECCHGNNLDGVILFLSGAKFEEHCSNISRDIVDRVLYCFSGTIYDVITFLTCIIQKRKYHYNEKRYSKKENANLLYFEKPFK